MRVFEKIGSRFRADVESMAIVDEDTGKIYNADWEFDLPEESPRRDFDASWFVSVDSDGTRHMRRFRADHGLLVCGQNPYAPEHGLVVMAGIYGFATWAAARLTSNPEFLKRCDGLRNFECLFRVRSIRTCLSPHPSSWIGRCRC